MDINTDRSCEFCGQDWRGNVQCPHCGRLENVNGLVRACAWCPTHKAIVADADAQGLTVTSGMCDFHARTLWQDATDAYAARLVAERAL